ncbi:Vacuolar-processing enzyme [Hibiscus syriacus]|uniref:Vacuolar-processing enzyme n=1 Tax=Hibiscus syriacus TaxID=106335 RepID=A0A6A2YEZ6_HIBSY|nr:Vacuolar-processing enzyme [Hibiscus syriacus]
MVDELGWLGNKSALSGGSGKVIDGKPNDRIFIYYYDHGGPGVLGMPYMPLMYAMNFLDILKKKHAPGSYREMVIYVEACESGSIFEGIMPNDLNIYVSKRTSNFNAGAMGRSHVMEYGNTSSKAQKLYLYQGFDAATYKNSEDGSKKKEIMTQITETMRHIIHLDGSIDLIGTLLYGPAKGSAILNAIREPGSPIVDDWKCLKHMVYVSVRTRNL